MSALLILTIAIGAYLVVGLLVSFFLFWEDFRTDSWDARISGVLFGPVLGVLYLLSLGGKSGVSKPGAYDREAGGFRDGPADDVEHGP